MHRLHFPRIFRKGKINQSSRAGWAGEMIIKSLEVALTATRTTHRCRLSIEYKNIFHSTFPLIYVLSKWCPGFTLAM